MSLRIAPLQPHQHEAARAVIFAVAYESFGRGRPYDVWYERVRSTWLTTDVDDLDAHYTHNGGAFWVLLDGDEVVGTGAVRRFNETTCELKRMYILVRARGLGWGRRMAGVAIEWSRRAGYQQMRLDTDSEMVAAVTLYRSLGFAPIEKYKEVGSDVYLELPL